jgi:hypothetical protein
MTATTPEQIHRLFEDTFNAGEFRDLAAVELLYGKKLPVHLNTRPWFGDPGACPGNASLEHW